MRKWQARLHSDKEHDLADLLAFDRQLSTPGGILVGIDEAGRGPLAGPVVSAAVVLNTDCSHESLIGLNDSKKLSPARREELAASIRQHAVAIGIGSASVSEIDRMDIEKATFLSMRRALEDSGVIPDLILVDGKRDPGLGFPTQCIIGGDGKSASIAAASILAKTNRDHQMEILSGDDDLWGMAQHKGYGTAYHLAALQVFGVSNLHRRSFRPVASAIHPSIPSGEFTRFWRLIKAGPPLAKLESIKAEVESRVKYLTRSEALILMTRIEERIEQFRQEEKPTNLRQEGGKCERTAADFLRKKGYQILHHNFRTSEGEIDLIAKDRDELVFVEVKMRGSDQYGQGEHAVDRRKRQRIMRSALDYLAILNNEPSCRFDVIAMNRDAGCLTHYVSAFSLDDGEDH